MFFLPSPPLDLKHSLNSERADLDCLPNFYFSPFFLQFPLEYSSEEGKKKKKSALPDSAKALFYKEHLRGLKIISQEPLPKRKAVFLPASVPIFTSSVSSLSGHETCA